VSLELAPRVQSLVQGPTDSGQSHTSLHMKKVTYVMFCSL
jgi:hypothetical protein